MGLGDFEDITSNTDDVAAQFAQNMIPATSVAPTQAAPQAQPGFFDSILSALTSKPMVTAAANKFIFGQPTTVQYQSTNPYAPNYIAPASNTILGIPTTYVLLGGAALLAMVMMKKGRR
jgi:hypothetical protein